MGKCLKNKWFYLSINIIVLIVGLSSLVLRYFINLEKSIIDNPSWNIVVCSVIIVNFLKYIRLYIVFLGYNIDGKENMVQFSKTVIVSVLLPFKLGDIFRGYCYGTKINNLLRGFILILLDRVVDTIALITFIIGIKLFFQGSFPMVFIVIFFFCFISVISYYCFPKIFYFWNHYLLKKTATKRIISILQLLNRLNEVYREIEVAISSKMLVLYAISIVSWAIEIGGVYLISNINKDNVFLNIVSDYLWSTLCTENGTYSQQYMICSVAIMFGFYCISVLLCEFFCRKERNKWEY